MSKPDLATATPGEGLLPRAKAPRVKIVNPICNDRGVIRRRTAEHFVSEGRAKWVGENQIRLIGSHPKNVAASMQASAFAVSSERSPSGEKVFHRPSKKTLTRDQAYLRYENRPVEKPLEPVVIQQRSPDGLADRPVLPLINYHPASLTKRNAREVTVLRRRHALMHAPTEDALEAHYRRRQRNDLAKQ